MAVVGRAKKRTFTDKLFGKTRFDKGMTKQQRDLLKKVESNMKKNKDMMAKSKGDSGKVNVFKKAMTKDKARLDKLRKQYGAVDPKSLKVSNRGMTPARTLAKGESKISRANMMKGKAPASANPEVKKKKARRNAAGTMGQMAYGGKVKKKMEAGGLAKAAKGAAMSVEKLKQITNKRNEAEARRKQAAEMQKMKPKAGDKKGMGPMGGQKPLQKPNNPGLSKLTEEVRNKMGYMKKGGKVKPGYHKMPDGKIMKDSAHKKPKKMASGGMVKKGCDGKAVRGKTKRRMV